METLAETPAIAENNAPGNAPEVDSEGVETGGAESAPAAAEPGKPDTRDKVQERFDKLTREKYEGLSRAERAEYRAQLAEQRLADIEARQTAKTQTVAPSDEFPTLESVGWDEQQFHKAVADFYTKQARESVKSELERERQAAQRNQTEQEWSRRQGDFIKAKPDYMEKVGSLPPSLMTDSLAAKIKAIDMGPEVAYYLAENVERLAAIAHLPDVDQAFEIGRIEARLEAAKTAPPPVSKAPPPPTKVESSESVVPKDPAEMTPAQFAKWRKQYM